jgi:hypothetical protein
MARLVQHLQVHRGLSSGVLNGNEEMKEHAQQLKEKAVSARLSRRRTARLDSRACGEYCLEESRWRPGPYMEKEGLELIQRENFLKPIIA